MAQVEELWRLALLREKELTALLDEQPNAQTVDIAISRLREAYVSIIFVDCAVALQRDVEGRIWGKHHRVIERYRALLNQSRETCGKRRPVEQRKLQNSFVNFIKQATRFYRSLVQRMVSHFGVLELEWVVRQFNLSVDIPDADVPSFGPDIKKLVISSCHRTLVFLGDLSRYREASQIDKNWGPATGYYTLARKLVPSSGSPHNQLAVIALNEGSNLSATYHLYRAVSVAEPFPEAGDNLGLGFRKVLKAHRAGNLAVNLARKEEQIVHELVALFVRLHAKCFAGKESAPPLPFLLLPLSLNRRPRFSDYEALESEMLTQLALDLKERTLSNGMLSKFVLINIAAQSYAESRPGFTRARSYFLRLNVATFTMLHQVFQPELERAAADKAENEGQPISAVGRRMLPGLRLYSAWLRINHPSLAGQSADTSMSVLIRQLWQTYANTLSLLGATFAIDTLPRVGYLLEEDDDTLGFLPFSHINGRQAFNWEDSTLEKAHPNDEMLARVSSLLEDGRKLCLEDNIPIALVDGTVVYQEDGIPSSTPFYRSPEGAGPYDERMAGPSISDISRQPMFPRPAESVLAQQGGTSIVDSLAGSETMNIAMNKMVDSLVGPREDPVPSEDEEILFSGRRRRKGAGGGRKKVGKPANVQDQQPATTTHENRPRNEGGTYTARDLAALVQNFTATH